MTKRGAATARALVVLGVAVVLAVSGCAFGNRGSLRASREVGRAFETLHVYPGYRYWYYYQENNPYAVIGLQPPWRVEDIHWTEVDPQSKTFEKVVGLVERFPAPGGFPFGAYILDLQGETIGVWYSSLSAGIRADPERRIVFIQTAMPWLDEDPWAGSGIGIGIGSGGAGVGVRIGY